MFRIFLLIIPLFALSAQHVLAEEFISDTFEYQTPDTSVWDYKDIYFRADDPHSQLAYADDDRRCGRTSSRITAREHSHNDTCGDTCQRAEVRDRKPHRPQWGDERWYGFSFKMSGDTNRTDSLRTVINQWKSPADDSPFLAQRYDNGVFHITVQDNDSRRTVACSTGNPHAIEELQRILAEINPTDRDATDIVEATKSLAPMAMRNPGLFSVMKTLSSVGSLIADDTAELPLAKQLSEYAPEFNCIQEPKFQYTQADLDWELGPSPTLPDPTDNWVDMQYRIKGGRTDNQSGPKTPGEIEIWANDRHVVTVRGNLGYALGATLPERMTQYFKHGIYRDMVPNVGTLVMHFDEYRQGATREDVRPSCERVAELPSSPEFEMRPFLASGTSVVKSIPLPDPASSASGTPVGERDFAKDPLRVVTWNVFKGTDSDVARRKGALIAAGKTIRPDVLVLEEVTSLSAAREIARFMGMGDADIAISDWSDDSAEWFEALEVAVISNLPIVSATEFETSSLNGRAPQTHSGHHAIPAAEELLTVPRAVNKNIINLGFRGVLRIELPGDLVVYGVHLKSGTPEACRMSETDRPSEDIFAQLVAAGRISNAEQRENVISATIHLAGQDIAAGKSALILGDFNIPLNEPSRTGSDIELEGNECVALATCERRAFPDTCQGSEGYDETHWILQSGLIDGIRFRALTEGLGRTYVRTEFADSPIDNIYIAGPLASQAKAAQTVPDPEFAERGRHFGSDHVPVLTEVMPSVQ